MDETDKCLEKMPIIVLEGIDRVGKTTQAAALKERLEQRGMDVRVERLPDRTTESGKLINRLLQSTSLSDGERAQLHLLFALNKHVPMKRHEEFLKNGGYLILDRYIHSGLVYAEADGFSPDLIHEINMMLPKPDLVFQIVVDPALAMTRRLETSNEVLENVQTQLRVHELFRNTQMTWFASMGRYRLTRLPRCWNT